jgi:high-affinity Fe2+/Pb2+ permease
VLNIGGMMGVVVTITLSKNKMYKCYFFTLAISCLISLGMMHLSLYYLSYVGLAISAFINGISISGILNMSYELVAEVGYPAGEALSSGILN